MGHMNRALLALWVVLALGTAAAEPPLVLENRQIALRFEARTGAWSGFIDRRTGDELVAGLSSLTTVAPARAAKLDQAQVARAVAEGSAVSLTGEWFYTPVPPPQMEATNFILGRFSAVPWAATPIPSRRGVGDDRLHNRVGDFWYRRAFTLPAGWPDEPMALVIGAVDDFDATWLNGIRIGGTGPETPHHWETPRFYRLPAHCLRRGETNMLLLKVSNPAFDGGIDGPVALGLAAKLRPPEPDAPPLTAHALTRESGTNVLRLAARDGAFEYRAEFALPDEGAGFTRRLAVKNISGKEQLFQTARYRTPPLSVGSEQTVSFPGTLPVGERPVASQTGTGGTPAPLVEGESVRPRSEEPLVILWDAAQRRGLGAWFHCEEEFSPASVRRVGEGAEILHSQHVIVRIQPGESVELGRQFFWLAHGPRDAVLRGVQEVYRAIGLRAPTDGLAGLCGMVLYCGHPGGPPELNYLRYGGFKAMRAYLPTLRKLGVDLLWLLPTWEHGDGRKWNLYSPFDHFQVDHLLGTAEELKELSRDGAALGIRLMFDLVPHGPPDFTPLAREHPEWIARQANGSNQVAWGQFAFDNHHPGWQDYMRRAAEWGAREFGAVGARVDCGAGGPLNWNREVGNRPSLSSLAAGLGMNRAIREGYLRIHPNVVVLPEEYTGANIFTRVSDLTYDAQFYYLQADLLAHNAPPSEWARDFQQFLHDQQQTLPPGGLKMRWISNHDTVSWTFQKQRPAKAYGVARMRALLALCALVEGVPMLYQGDEDPAVYGGQGENSLDFLARIYGLRKKLPALREGSADYNSVRATDGVFACLRQAPGQAALVLISFNPAPVETVVSLPVPLAGPWNDAFSLTSLTASETLHLSLAPYEVRVLTR